VQGYVGNFKTCADIINHLRENLSEADYAKLMEKAKAVDEGDAFSSKNADENDTKTEK
jgi:hypothetical protein